MNVTKLLKLIQIKMKIKIKINESKIYTNHKNYKSTLQNYEN